MNEIMPRNIIGMYNAFAAAAAAGCSRLVVASSVQAILGCARRLPPPGTPKP
jgi:nucleoside-diphosphate-sugar epimerase